MRERGAVDARTPAILRGSAPFTSYRHLRVNRRRVEHRHRRVLLPDQQPDLGAAEDDPFRAARDEIRDHAAIRLARALFESFPRTSSHKSCDAPLRDQRRPE
jgi:hypothetical protein